MKYQLLSQLTKNGRRGYTLLFSVIVSVLVLSVAAFILSISRKQFILSSAARDSMYAFYASDSGLECGVNSYNTKGSPISTSSISKAATGGSLAVSCGGGTWTGTPAAGGTAQAATTTWSMPIPVLGGVPTACSIVTAAYHSSNADGTGATTYYITSLGYNIGWDNNGRQCNQYGSRRVERGLRYVVNF